LAEMSCSDPSDSRAKPVSRLLHAGPKTQMLQQITDSTNSESRLSTRCCTTDDFGNSRGKLYTDTWIDKGFRHSWKHACTIVPSYIHMCLPITPCV